MNICVVAQVLAALAASHSDVPANQAKIAQVVEYTQQQCVAEQKKAEKEAKKKAESKE